MFKTIRALDEVFDLFVALDANEDQLDFPTLYASGRSGWADEALDGEKRVFGVGDRLALGRLSDEAFAVLGKGHHGGRGAHAFGVFDDFGSGAIHDRDTGVGRAKVNANDF